MVFRHTHCRSSSLPSESTGSETEAAGSDDSVNSQRDLGDLLTALHLHFLIHKPHPSERVLPARPARGTAPSHLASAWEILAGIRRLRTPFPGLPGLSAARDLSPPCFRQRSPWARAMAGRSSSPRSSSPGLDRGREARVPTAGFIALSSASWSREPVRGQQGWGSADSWFPTLSRPVLSPPSVHFGSLRWRVGNRGAETDTSAEFGSGQTRLGQKKEKKESRRPTVLLGAGGRIQPPP